VVACLPARLTDWLAGHKRSTPSTTCSGGAVTAAASAAAVAA